jgi:phage N-6-adenine-methyltransferase
MSTTIRRRSKESESRTLVPTLAELVRAGIASANRIKAADDAVRRHTADALHEWLDQSYRLNIARDHHKLRGGRFVDFARRIGVDRSSSYQLVKLWQYRDAVLERCDHEQHYPGWQTCLAWFEAPRRRWPTQNPNFGTSDERGTPVAIFARYGKHCTLDVAASPALAKCPDYFTRQDNGLKRRWHGVVWLNPPFSDIAPWVRRALEYAQVGGTVIALLPVWTDAEWFRDYAPFGRITFLRKRVAYIGKSGSAPFPSMVVEWSPESLKRRRGVSLNVALETETAP